ncbi:response regulator [Paracoccus seriniphilus]|uniref:Regulatory protein VirG n=1 Tax=Paracoccus seriniphilus TaxID=184748 RepID=A0A239PUT9_9RHOB|nr:response regulator transcription factor [Paracoccus seriniphilus]WCR15400.1 response regulator transcription factor [Paracoccus seriniphilus]SNT73888.1 DNA-binding response regulator, OmpR family, contains REC and winged-helix (wHTH) domain [Paracoccus seriniphilus]
MQTYPQSTATTRAHDREECPYRILFVEDDRKLASFLARYFGEEGFQVQIAGDGPTMREALAAEDFEIVVLDIGLPGRDDGYALARELKKEHDLGVMFLSARHEALDRIVGLEIGADDYLVKPFEPRELLARVRAILRRMPGDRSGPAGTATQAPAGPNGKGTTLTFDGWRLDLEARSLYDSEGREQVLTTQEFNLLSVLAQRPGRVLSRDQLLDLTASRHWAPNDRSIDVMIGKIRRKIGDSGPDYRRIRTIRGVGYMFSSCP